jgi:hypothetical protein
MKEFSIHTSNCPEGCTHGWTLEKLSEIFETNHNEEIEKLEVGAGGLYMSEDCTIVRDC